MHILYKAFDILIFATLGYLAFQSYTGYNAGLSPINPLLIDIVALAYVMVRKYKDVNIASLVLIGLLFKPVNMAVMSGAAGMSGFAYYPLVALLNGFVLVAVWMRPVIFSHFGPFKNRKGWAITNADDGLTIVLVLMIVFNVLMVVEQTIRRLGLNITWFYNSYEYVQLGFMLASIAILWFMTTDKANAQSHFRKQQVQQRDD